MRTQTEFDYLAETEAQAPLYFGVRIDSSFFVTARPLARDGASCDDQASSADRIEGWARHASVANGFGDVATTVTAPASSELHEVAREHRAFALGTTILAAIRAVGALLHSGSVTAWARGRRRAHVSESWSTQVRARVAAAFLKVTRAVDERTAHRKTRDFYRSSGAAWTRCLN